MLRHINSKTILYKGTPLNGGNEVMEIWKFNTSAVHKGWWRAPEVARS